uniref:Uncharacterized protein n=1 Tax=Pipistrellus kuhlii TaxID=59472 RepID=A0A7J7T1N9_PIPKU|nr:hypothetical protein mPipKuh1_009715 [Pipistrellus kuhlii]
MNSLTFYIQPPPPPHPACACGCTCACGPNLVLKAENSSGRRRRKPLACHQAPATFSAHTECPTELETTPRSAHCTASNTSPGQIRYRERELTASWNWGVRGEEWLQAWLDPGAEVAPELCLPSWPSST